jgi:hypothetical protein
VFHVNFLEFSIEIKSIEVEHIISRLSIESMLAVTCQVISWQVCCTNASFW